MNFAGAEGNSVIDTKAMHTSLLSDYQMSPLDATTRIADFALILLTLGNMGRETHTCENAAPFISFKALEQCTCSTGVSRVRASILHLAHRGPPGRGSRRCYIPPEPL